MLDLLRPLFEHQEWADRKMLQAVEACPAARTDEKLRETLFHIVVVQRFFWMQFTGGKFDLEKELQAPRTWLELAELFNRTHQAELEFTSSVEEAALERVLELPRLEGVRPTVAQAMTQVVMHSQHHRGQCAARLRELGGAPPVTDYILWLGNR